MGFLFVCSRCKEEKPPTAFANRQVMNALMSARDNNAWTMVCLEDACYNANPTPMPANRQVCCVLWHGPEYQPAPAQVNPQPEAEDDKKDKDPKSKSKPKASGSGKVADTRTSVPTRKTASKAPK